MGDDSTWEEMKQAKMHCFFPSNYKQRVQHQFIQLRQVNMIVDTYTREFYLATHGDFNRDEDNKIALYKRGLKL